MHFDWVTFGLQAVNLLVLLAILRHFLFRPVADIVARRQAQTREAMDAADAARLKAEEAISAAKAEAEKTAALRQGVLDATQADAQTQAQGMLEAAQAEAANITANAHREALHTVADAEEATLSRARDLAETIAHRALAALPNPPDVAGFAQRLAEAIDALPDAQRAALFSAGPLRLVAPQPLSAADLEAVLYVLRPLGIDNVKPESDPALLAGLELRSANGIVHNSLAYNLQQISEAMKDGDGSGA